MSKKKKLILIISIVLIAVVVVSSLIVVFDYVSKCKEKRDRELAIKQYREAKISLYQQENAMYDDYEVDVAFLGDSLTDLYDVKSYYSQYTVVNRGVGGDKTFDLENRLKVSVYDLKPKVAVMLIGANNFSTMFENYERIVSSLKTNLPNTDIVLLSLTAMRDVWGRNNELACFNNVKIELIAQKYNCTFVDMFTPLFDLNTNGIYPEYTTDGGHLTDKGYEAVTNILTPVLNGLL